MMKILYLAWAKHDDQQRRMGGIRVYMNDLVNEMASQGHEVICLSSGYLYSPFTSRTWIEKSKVKSSSIKNYVVINSGVIAPAMFISNDFENVFSHVATELAFLEFLKQNGPFDVVHIQSMEGLPYSVLGIIKKEMPSTRIIYSLHHYHDICPKIDLYKEKEGVLCKDYDNGRSCVGCYTFDYISLRRRYNYDYIMYRLGLDKKGSQENIVNFFKNVWRATVGLRRIRHQIMSIVRKNRKTVSNHFYILDPKIRDNFKHRREHLRNILQDHVDLFLPVSQRTMEVYQRNGYNSVRFHPLYIGIKLVDKISGNSLSKGNKTKTENLTICFMGYPSKLKGFEVFISAMKLIKPVVSKKISIVIAGKVSEHYMNDIKEIAEKFDSIEIYNGYSREDQEKFLSKVDIGIVPPQWEDNLPQVAYEFYCNGIPFICSELGGAQELIGGDRSYFVFQHNRPVDLTKRIVSIFYDRRIISKFKGIKVHGMSQHAAHVIQIYKKEIESLNKQGVSEQILSEHIHRNFIS